MTRSLDELPPEVLDLIVAQFSSLNSLSRLARTCKRLYTYGETDGYRAFTRANFPSYRLLYWKDAARSLTGITKCWEERNLLARYIEPPHHVTASIESGTRRSSNQAANQRFQGQSIGYPATLDCREEWAGGDWRSRKEILAIGAGADLRIRTRYVGPGAQTSWKLASTSERERFYDQFHNHQQWMIYRDKNYKDGESDITTVKIAPNCESSDARRIVYGRACGALEQITLSDGFKQKKRFDVNKGSIKFADLSPGNESLLLSGHPYDLSLFHYSTDGASPVSGLHFEREGRGGMIWTGQFVDKDRIALGRDSKLQPLAVFDVRPEEIDKTPTWKVAACTNFTGVKTMAPIRPQYGDEGQTNLLLTAWKWGVVLLHDLRSPEHHVARFSDHIDLTCKFYSLLPYGTERFVAGSNRHGSIKVFDLRVTGTKSYSSSSFHHTPTQTSRRRPSKSISGKGINDDREMQIFPGSRRYDFTLFLRQSTKGQINRRRRAWVPSRNMKDSSVYSLAAASQYSPTFYAGLEGTTVQVDLVSATDPFPDVVFEPSCPIFPPPERNAQHVKQWLDPWSEQITMGLIEADRPNVMFQQSALGPWSVVK
jgi:hypothetical protein